VEFTVWTAVMAVAIGTMVFILATVRGVGLKALLFAFPVLITSGLIATRRNIDATNIAGLFLIWVFLWLTHLMSTRLRVPIILADVLGAIGYVGVGVLANRWIAPFFWPALGAFAALWGLLVWRWHRDPATEGSAAAPVLSPVAKGAIATGVSALMLAAAPLIAGVVVTFPYQGLFAVIEVKDNLHVFARTAVRNSIAVAGMFVSMYALRAHLDFIPNLIVGWLVFVALVLPVSRLRV
jgi:hypothetical protein